MEIGAGPIAVRLREEVGEYHFTAEDAENAEKS
jgi:hypothetical protein